MDGSFNPIRNETQPNAQSNPSEDSDGGTLHLDVSPAMNFLPSESPRCSAQALAKRYLEGSYELGHITLTEYHAKVGDLRRAVLLGVDSAATCTENIITLLRRMQANGWLVGRWHFVSVDCDHFASETWEKSFACSYRNTQCILSALFRLSEFRKRLFGSLSAMPSVWKLQSLLESAWSMGFDPIGASQLAEAIGALPRSESVRPTSSVQSEQRALIGLVDSTAWLGATDLAALLGSVGVQCSLIECQAPSGPQSTHPNLLEHIYMYIKAGRSCGSSTEVRLQSFSAPLFLQHEGHSRIVIGVEVNEADRPIALMILDPSTPVEAMRQLAKAAEVSTSANPGVGISHHPGARYHWSDVLGSMRVDAARLNHPQYQLLQVNGLVETELELQDAMIPENITIAIS